MATIAQHYRDRADTENIYDELKNQWGWGGHTTRDMHRCQVMARIVAQVYNWWTIYAGLAVPDRHAEAVTSRPLLLYAVGRQVRHAVSDCADLSSPHMDRILDNFRPENTPGRGPTAFSRVIVVFTGLARSQMARRCHRR